MKEPILVVLAAGMGSRYGGLKQIDPIGPNGEIILELSIFDAMRAGFKRIVFIIKKEIEKEFKQSLVSKLPKELEIQFVYQSVDQIPAAFSPTKREKPWGTGHALLCCKDVIDAPFGVINADDFYGRESFQLLYDFLVKQSDHYAIISYILKNTLTENGSVARGICEVENNKLVNVVERTKIQKINGETAYFENDTWHTIDENSAVSMNMWGFQSAFIEYLKTDFERFLATLAQDDITSEYYIPFAVNNEMVEKKRIVEMIVSNAKWFGVTYQADKEAVKAGIQKLINQGEYPAQLWK